MQIIITKGEREDDIEAMRPDGSSVRTSFPHKGPIPHDAVHFYVETSLAIGDAFWGMVAAGSHPEEVASIAKAGGHASAKRAGIPESSIVRLIQAERAVECFEADLWSGSSSNPETIRDAIAAGCEQSLVPAPEISDDAILEIQSSLRDLVRRWPSLPVGERLVFEWRLAA
ncbi:MAG: hypothetical protein ACM3IG_09705 [Myxococcales bacterium]